MFSGESRVNYLINAGGEKVPRKPIDDGLDAFRVWLISTDRASPATAKTYLSCTRKVAREIGGFPSESAVKDYFAHAYSHETSYPNLKSAWRAYVEWRKEGGDTVPSAPDAASSRKRGPKRSTALLPEEVRSALRDLVHDDGVTAKKIPQMTWADMPLEGINSRESVLVPVPNEPSTFWRCKVASIKVLWEWAQVGEDLWKPLVPAAPGEESPYPYRALLQAIHTLDRPVEEILNAEPVEQEKEKEITPANYHSDYMAKPPEGVTLFDLLGAEGVGLKGVPIDSE